MNIIDKFNYTNGLKYYGVEDLSINWELAFVFNNYDELIIFINEYSLPKEDYDYNNFIDYFWFIKQSKLVEVIPSIVEDKMEMFKRYIERIVQVLSIFERSFLNKFIIHNYVTIFEDRKEKYDHDLKRLTIDYVFENNKSFKKTNIIEHIESNYWFLIVDKIDKYFSFYKRNKEQFFANVLNERKALAKIDNYNRVFDLLEFLSTKENFQSESKRIAKKVVNHILTVVENEITVEDYLKHLDLLEEGIKLASIYKLKEIQKFEQLKKDITKYEKEYFSKHGHTFKSNEINLSELIDKFKNDKRPVILRFMGLTHIYDSKTTIFNSIFDSIMESRASFTDFVNHIGLEYDDYFSPSRIMQVEYISNLNIDLIYLIIKDESLFNEMANNYFAVLQQLRADDILTDSDLNEYSGMISMIRSVFDMDENNDNIAKSLWYSLAMLIVAFIEKLLRKLYIKNKESDDYVDINSLYMGFLIESDVIKKCLGEHLANIIKYFLSRVPVTKIGNNLRNKLMHNVLEFDQIKIEMPVTMMYLLINLLNGVGRHYVKTPPPVLIENNILGYRTGDL